MYQVPNPLLSGSQIPVELEVLPVDLNDPRKIFIGERFEVLCLDVLFARVPAGRCVHDVQLVVVLLNQGLHRIQEAESVILCILQGQEVGGREVRVARVALLAVRGPVGGGA